MTASITTPGFLSHMLKWYSQNGRIFALRHEKGWEIKKSHEGFSVLNRKGLCSCQFHTHAAGRAHKGHESCNAATPDCSHPDQDKAAESKINAKIAFLNDFNNYVATGGEETPPNETV